MSLTNMENVSVRQILSEGYSIEPEELYEYNTPHVKYNDKIGVIPYQSKVDTLLNIEPSRNMLIEIAGSLDVKRTPAMSPIDPKYTREILYLNESKYGRFIEALYNAHLVKPKNKSIVDELVCLTNPKEIYLVTYFYSDFKSIYRKIGAYPSIFREAFNFQDDYNKFLDEMLFVQSNFRRIYPTIEFLRKIKSAYEIFQLELNDPDTTDNSDMEQFERYDYPNYDLLLGYLCDFLEC